MTSPPFLPVNIGILHFIGIGGIGMSGIAEVMHALGYTVQGSDIKESTITQRLKTLGIPVFIEHNPLNINDAAFVIYSTAISRANPELQAAIQQKKRIVKRAEMLAELMRNSWSIAIAGTHGKTTTTSLTAALLEAGGFDPTVINGGIINTRGVNAWLGQGKWIVTEADESDGSFLRLPATIGIVTSVDPEHLDHYKSVENLHNAFRSFLENIPFYGLGITCIDHEQVRHITQSINDRRIITYGFHQDAIVHAHNVKTINHSTSFNVTLNPTPALPSQTEKTFSVSLPMLGNHNVQNTLAAIAASASIGVHHETIIHALSQFRGVRRRFTLVGEHFGRTFIDDYAHHPAEIHATLSSAALIAKNKIIAVFQPHRYSRIQHLYPQFITSLKRADIVFVSPVYAAGEDVIPSITPQSISDDMKTQGIQAIPFNNPQELPPLLAEYTSKNDIIVFLGAGSVSSWAHSMPQNIAPFLSSSS